MKVKEIINYLENRFPKNLASDFDNERIGLIIGDENIDVNNIILTLDLNYEVINEAITNNVNLIISHHPYIFNPLFKILFNSEKGKVLELMFKHQISLYVMHTNLDVGSGGVNDVLASYLGIKNIQIVNEEIGKDNFLRFGEIEPITLNNLTINVKNSLGLSGVRVAGDLNKTIKTVGIIGGGGGSIKDIYTAINNNIDCYITGEIKLNVAQEAIYNSLCLIEVNHGVEKIVFNKLKEELEYDLNLENKVFVSTLNTDPFQTL